MKPFILALVVMSFLPPLLYSQKTLSPIYVKMYGAYGVISPGSFNGESSKFTSRIDTGVFNVSRKGIGQGLRIGGGIGVVVSDYINIGTDVEYHSGSTLHSAASYTQNDVSISSSTTMDYDMLSIIPNVTFKAVTQPTYYVYCRVGLVIAIPGDIKEVYDYEAVKILSGSIPNRTVSRTTIHTEAVYALKAGLGYVASLGLQFSISRHLRAFVEVNGYRLALNRERFEEVTKTKRTAEELENPEAPQPNSNATFDHSRNLIYYREEGKQTVQTSGVGTNFLFTYVQPQKQININTVAIGCGLQYRF